MATSTHAAFAGRGDELERLDQGLALAVGGSGQVVFVTGEAGSGKTTLIAEFARRAESSYAHLLYAYADCDARTGSGDAYLPFREVLGLLAGETAADVAQGNLSEEGAGRLKRFLDASGEVVFEAGTEVLGAFLPGAGLVARLATRLAGGRHGGRRSASLGPAQIQEQYTGIIHRTAERHPLVLVVDDMQWADAASLALFFHLARRLEGSRVLLVGSYRPGDVALGRGGERHPLEEVVSELKRYRGDVVMDLEHESDASRRGFVAELLASRPNRFDGAFLDRLVAHTGGHALFVVEVLAALGERGGIVQGPDGVWEQGREIDWSAIPARVEGIIEQRVGRLDDDLRESLTVASVEGEEFNAEVVGAVRSLPVRPLVGRLSGDAGRRHRLVTAQGMRRVGAARLSGYRFSHALFHRFLYGRIDAVERPHLHHAVGQALEALLGQTPDEFAVALAGHFVEAGDDERSVVYLLAAGRRALRLSAYGEALAHLRRGLDLLPRIPPGPDRDRTELALLAAAGTPLVATRGYADPEVRRVLDRAQDLASAVGDDDELIPILFGLVTFTLARGDVAGARAIAERRVALARQWDAAPDILRETIVSLAFVLLYMGEVTASTALIREAAAIEPGDGRGAAVVLLDADSAIHRGLGLLHWLGGRPEEGASAAERAIRETRGGAPYHLATALGFALQLAVWREDLEDAVRLAGECHALGEREGYAFWIAFGDGLGGWAEARLAIERGDDAGAVSGSRGLADTIDRFTATGTLAWRSWLLSLHADLLARSGRAPEAAEALDAALDVCAETGVAFWEAEILRQRAALLAPQDPARARGLLRRAVEVARRQGAAMLEGRAVAALREMETPAGGDPAGDSGE